MERFCAEDYVMEHITDYRDMSFEKLCEVVGVEFRKRWQEERDDFIGAMLLQKKAIIGYEKEVGYLIDKIDEFIKSKNYFSVPYPSWYESLAEGIYHENWGMAGMAEWFGERFRNSSSAKIIGNDIFYLDRGKMKLMEQKISKDRREQLIRGFLLLTPQERMDRDFHEIYLLDGTRITIFKGKMVKQDREVIIFRRYIIPEYSFKQQESFGTIPKGSGILFEYMVKAGFNVAFTGPVRSAKTSFLSTWQRYEDPELEGVMVETDPEIRLHEIMPFSPIVQIIADNEKLKNISKNLLRSDADYFILAEARDGIALDTAIRIASKGTRRMKMTFHTRDPLDFPYDVASEIVKSMGGDIAITSKKVAASIDYIFHFVQLADKSKKRLKCIYELLYDKSEDVIKMQEICRYNFRSDNWRFSYLISEEKKRLAEEENYKAFHSFDLQLKKMSERKQ